MDYIQVQKITCEPMSTIISLQCTSVFKDTNVAKHLSYLHGKYVVVPAEMVPNKIDFPSDRSIV